MRISEALALRLGDVTEDGLIVGKTKFHKSRLIPLHATTRKALNDYLSSRLPIATCSDAVFIANTGSAPPATPRGSTAVTPVCTSPALIVA